MEKEKYTFIFEDEEGKDIGSYTINRPKAFSNYSDVSTAVFTLAWDLKNKSDKIEELEKKLSDLEEK